jgi:hypothetical protein
MSYAKSLLTWPARARPRSSESSPILPQRRDSPSAFTKPVTWTPRHRMGGMTLVQSEHAQRRMDRAHPRFLNTVKTLAAVRRLALPALQIDVAQRQQIAQLNGGGSS